ncbi:hypothetical protein PTTG_27360 [Puccinia triticina 1-1 BBBD Race 1]|uniref:Uncharacterized protein n=1 Tax=Puccinia triticina (isolate 1-1 / race 1 (BBBD)) TaxID=630390 RepID=A0A180GMW9_PUCT1|nr:hypothetical protein PTTG_27360 [Puccinia triticina 1-1 BBBD Race 1]
MSRNVSNGQRGNGSTPSSTNWMKELPNVSPVIRGAIKNQTPDSNKMRKISLEYCFYVATGNEESSSTRGSNKRKAVTEPDANSRQLVSDPGKLYILWDVEHRDLFAFKRAVINVIRDKDAATHAQEQEDEGMITWIATIPNGGLFAGEHVALEHEDRFLLFLSECKQQSADCKITVSLFQKDSKQPHRRTVARKRISLFGDYPKYPALSPPIVENICLIRATHLPCERLSGSSTDPVFINPKHPTQFVVLSTNMMVHWAKGMITSKEITVHNPPSLPAFNFTSNEVVDSHPDNQHDTADSRKPSDPKKNDPLGQVPASNTLHSSPILNPNLQPSPARNANAQVSPVSIKNEQTASVAAVLAPPADNTASAPASSIPTQICSLEDYFRFAHVPACATMYNALRELGITHHSMFERLLPCQLQEVGVKPGPARALTFASSIPEQMLSLEDYFRLAHVPACATIYNALGELGITHHSMFEHFLPSELQKVGVKPEPARALTFGMRNYKSRISSIRAETQ